MDDDDWCDGVRAGPVAYANKGMSPGTQGDMPSALATLTEYRHARPTETATAPVMRALRLKVIQA